MPRSAIAALAAASALAAVASAQPSMRPAIDPSAKALFERHISLVTPRSKPRFTRMVTEVASPNGIVIRVERFTMRPDKIVTRTSMPLGVIRMGFDGDVGWTTVPRMGTTLLEGEALRVFKESATDAALLAVDRFATLVLVGRDTLEGRPVHHLVGTAVAGDSAAYYMDVESGLLAGLRVFRATGQPVDSNASMLFGDYTRFGRQLLPATMRMRVGGREVITRTLEFDDSRLDPAIFARPKIVQEILKRRVPPT